MTTASNPIPAQATLLVVDDEQTLRDTLEYNLRRDGYRVLTAADGPEALLLAFSELPDLIILDIMLPGMSGFDVCRALRQRMSVPIIMLSAREGEIDKVLGLELGADDYITKPFSLAELTARVHARLRRAEIPGTQQSLAQPLNTTTSTISAPVVSPTEAGRGADVDLHTRRTLVSGGVSIELATRTVLVSGRPVEMKRMEFDLLAFLAGHPMKVFSRGVA